MTNPTAAMLVIGDEILSGRTRDANMFHLAGQLTEQGINLKEVRVVSDDATAIIAAIQALSESYAHVFTSGGIGPTHDDITADCIAEAFGAPISIRADARAILQAHYDTQQLPLNDARLRMARIPNGATLIDNPVSKAPGFTIGNVHVMAGVPSIFQAMVASVLPSITGGQPLISQTYRVARGEGDKVCLGQSEFGQRRIAAKLLRGLCLDLWGNLFGLWLRWRWSSIEERRNVRGDCCGLALLVADASKTRSALCAWNAVCILFVSGVCAGVLNSAVMLATPTIFVLLVNVRIEHTAAACKTASDSVC